jgi:ribonucleoside-diphosphate reductase beta chain
MKKVFNLTEERLTFRPMPYEWAYEAWLQHEQSSWLHTELDFHSDVQDYKLHLNESEKTFLTNILRFFVTGDLSIGEGYHKHYLPVFKAPEVRMMLSGFAAREALHVAAYAHLIESLGLPESTYGEFLKHKEMVEKHTFLSSIDQTSIPEKISAISSFGEGVQLFGSFVCLLNFARHGKLRSLGQVISWSIADETQHAEGMIKLFREYIKENKSEWTDETKSKIYVIAETMVKLENDFIDLIFGLTDMEGLAKEDVKQYIKYLADRRLIAMGLKGIFKVKKNPLPWVEEMLGVSHSNFFETKSTDYAKGALSGTWADVWAA